MQVVQNWLKGNQNFAAGRAIYNVIGDKPEVKVLLEKGETSFAKSILIDYLASFSIEKLTNVSETVATPEQMPDSDNPILIAIKNEWTPLYQKMNYLRHSLDKKFEDENSQEAINYRLPVAKEILELEKQVMQIWEKRDHYLQHGTLPAEQQQKVEIPTEALELATFLNNVKRNIRHNRKMLRENPDNAKYASLLMHYEKLLLEITGKE